MNPDEPTHPDTPDLPDDPTPFEPDWKTRIRDEFEQVLASLEDSPESSPDPPTKSEGEGEDDGDSVPDIYTFYETLAALRHEIRQGNRRTVEAYSQVTEALTHFDGELKWLRNQRESEAKHAPSSGQASDPSPAWLLQIVELADRIKRLRKSFGERPNPFSGWFASKGNAEWEGAWEERETACALLADQIEGLLASIGLTPIPAQGCPFDPKQMIALGREAHTGTETSLVVIEEIIRGYTHQNRVVRLAEVRVGPRPLKD